jgi:hypothetical protein
MKISLKKLRRVVREELEHLYMALGSDDKALRPGSDVGVATPTGPVAGKVVSRYSGDGPNAIWTVKTDKGTVQKKAVDLKTSDPSEDEETLLRGSTENDDEKKGDRDGDGLSDDELLIDITEVDEKREQKAFTERHYEFMARQIVFNWRDQTPEVSWKAVADNFARGLRSTTGKMLDVEKLYDAIQTCLNDDDAYEADWKNRKGMIGVR